MKVITLREPAICADCGKKLPAGTRARYYSRDQVYCEEHPDSFKKVAAITTQEPAAPVAVPMDASRAADIRTPAAARQPVTRAELIHVLEGIRFIIDSAIDQLRRD